MGVDTAEAAGRGYVSEGAFSAESYERRAARDARVARKLERAEQKAAREQAKADRLAKPAKDAAIKEAAREHCAKVANTIPPEYQGWGYERTHRWKLAADVARRAANGRATTATLQAAAAAVLAVTTLNIGRGW